MNKQIWQMGRVWQGHPRGDKFPLKRAWSGLHDRFYNFKPSSIFLEWTRLRCLNLESESTTVSPTPNN